MVIVRNIYVGRYVVYTYVKLSDVASDFNMLMQIPDHAVVPFSLVVLKWNTFN